MRVVKATDGVGSTARVAGVAAAAAAAAAALVRARRPRSGRSTGYRRPLLGPSWEESNGHARCAYRVAPGWLGVARVWVSGGFGTCADLLERWTCVAVMHTSVTLSWGVQPHAQGRAGGRS